MKQPVSLKPSTPLAKAAAKALKRAHKRAREVARQHGTPIHVMRNGKVVALKP
jgi:hypothetical protein